MATDLQQSVTALTQQARTQFNSATTAVNNALTAVQQTANTVSNTVAAGVRQANSLINKALTTEPPPNAAAAPKGNTKYTYLGLCAAMNQYEQELVQAGTVEIANQYEVVFAPASLAASKIKIPGQTDKSKTPMQQDRTAKAVLDPKQNSMSTEGVNRSVAQGTQIMQFIEMVMRNSTYITDQQTAIIDPVSGQSKPSNSSSKNDTTRWFSILVKATPIGTNIDKKRNDWAYKLTYTVTPYEINQSESQYFPASQFRGAHKVYNYWFTGENSQVLSYEQKFDQLYFIVLNGETQSNVSNSPELAKQISWTPTRVPTTASGQSDQGADKGANNPASTLADFLYSQADQGSIDLQIVGDPAWLQQSSFSPLDALNYTSKGFFPDGTINTTTQQAVFVVNWNLPADYNNSAGGPQNGSGLMDINAGATQGNNSNLQAAQTQQSAAYIVNKIKHTFSHGKFIQDISGTLLSNLQEGKLSAYATENARPVTSAPTVDTKQPQVGSRKSEVLSSTATASSITMADQLNPNKWPREVGDVQIATATPADVNIETLSKQAAAGAPTSNGEVVGRAQPNPLSPREAGEITNQAIPVFRQDQLNQNLAAAPVPSTNTQTMAPKEA
jgi:hypothetical protein